MSFSWVSENTQPPTSSDFTSATTSNNQKKNRYRDILANEKTRVKINSLNESTDYINANYILNGRIIAAQAPLPSTVENFLTMIQQEGVAVVIMLTKVIERRSTKASAYWGDEGDGGKRRFGSFTVTTIDSLYPDVDEDNFQHNVQVRYLQVAHDSLPPFSFIQIQYLAWPDMGVPGDPRALLDVVYMQYVFAMTEKLSDKNVVVIHCSAGVGRTGVYAILQRIVEVVVHKILEKDTEYSSVRPGCTLLKVRDIEDKIEELQAKDEIVYDDVIKLIPELIVALRSERSGMVQTEEQFGFIYNALDIFFKEAVPIIQDYYEVFDALLDCIEPTLKDHLLNFINKIQL
ncbi:Tyrosine protein phosphatase [Entamoeba marina]